MVQQQQRRQQQQRQPDVNLRTRVSRRSGSTIQAYSGETNLRAFMATRWHCACRCMDRTPDNSRLSRMLHSYIMVAAGNRRHGDMTKWRSQEMPIRKECQKNGTLCQRFHCFHNMWTQHSTPTTIHQPPTLVVYLHLS